MYDVIVLGVGGIGSAALYHLARRGLRVLGIDRFAPPHDRGSTHGQTRIIRQAYFEHPDYVPLLKRAYALWQELEEQTGRQLYCPCGLLEVGPPNGVVIPGVLASAAMHGLEIQFLSAEESRRRFPAFHVPDGWQAVFERNAGYLRVEPCVQTHLDEAVRLGAQLRMNEAVHDWRIEHGVAVVETDLGNYTAPKLVVSAGAWARDLLADLGVPLRVVRKHLHWFATDDPCLQASHGCPTFFFETPQGYYYGFPQIDAQGLKAAEHSGGEAVDDPLTLDRNLDSSELARVQAFLETFVPGVSSTSTAHAVCMYTLTPDEHFLVGRHPQYSELAFVAGLSGHGFKFAAVLGEILAQLVTEGTSPHSIEFLSARRFSS